MSSRISELIVACVDPEKLASFWCAVLGYVELDREDDGSIEIGPATGFGGAAPTLIFSPVPEPKKDELRLHIDVSPVDRDQDAELARLLSLGATHADVGQPDDVSWYVLADPEGHIFCLLRKRIPEL